MIWKLGDLAGGGLVETSLWDVLTESDKQQIIDINKNYSKRGSLKNVIIVIKDYESNIYIILNLLFF
ncbi:hypothetical protein CBW18_08885 [Pedobacter sp. AJM]|nr:hypothetical protein CBW18_08885 [Pedobacter sp. AJM]